ncbi:MAG: transcriptional repressor [Candidatus Obscuribacterales bacterium]|nr:transcriptional repressor [Candidatus Obscuribacterales bacterium]
MTLSSVEDILIEHGVKPTPQRVVIAKYMLETHSHPTADEVLQAVESKLPVALSRATVYNTLNTLVQAGVIREVVTEAERTRYDANMTEHHHFVDVKSGKILDIPADQIAHLKPLLGNNYKVHSYQITFFGEVKDQ